METSFVQGPEGMPPVQVIRGIAKKHWMDFSGGKKAVALSLCFCMQLNVILLLLLTDTCCLFLQKCFLPL